MFDIECGYCKCYCDNHFGHQLKTKSISLEVTVEKFYINAEL